MLNEFVRNAEATDAARIESGVAGRFQHRRAKATDQCTFLHGHHKTTFADGAQDRFRIQRLNEPHIDYAYMQAFVVQLLSRG